MLALLLLTALMQAASLAPVDDPFLENSVTVSSTVLYVNRAPQRRSRMNNLDERTQISTKNSSNSDVVVEEMLFVNRNDSASFDPLFDLKPGSTRFYVVVGAVMLFLLSIVTTLLWWFVCRPKPVPRRFNPRYEGPPPKRLSKLSFRALRHSMTGNAQLKSGRFRTSECKMEPSVSTVSAASVP